MNYRLVFNQLGLLFVVLSVILLTMATGFFLIERVLAHLVDAEARIALLVTGLIGLIFGGGLWLGTRHGTGVIGRREALLLVGASWLFGAAFCALPFYFWAHLSPTIDPNQPFHQFVNCYFESMSGLTTTGASVLTDIEVVPRSLLLWRALTHWLGGLGIVVLFVAVLPAVGTSARKLFRAEVSGVTKQGVRPQIRDTARILWYIYLIFTIAQVVALRICGMGWFDSICHTFATLATGGFSTKNASIAAYDSTLIEIVIIIFMVAGGVNFALYYHMMRSRWATVFRDPELRLYLALLLCGTLIMAAFMYAKPISMLVGDPAPGSIFNSTRYAVFQVVSLQTTTGFVTAEYDDWFPLAKGVLFFLVFVGGCAGSTAGGFKVIRLWIVLKALHAQVERAFRPSVIRPIRIGAASVDQESLLGILSFFAAFLLILTVCTAALMGLESHHGISLSDALSGTLACVATTGPGTGPFGAAENYGWLTAGSKWMLCCAMILGRLEIFTILVLLTPRFWRDS